MTNLYAYILGSRFELQLMKILHENSSVAFTEEESDLVDWENVGGENLKEIFQDSQNYLQEFQEIINEK